MQRLTRVRQKWRPSMALVIAMVCGALVSIPLAAMLTVQATSNQFVRETENSLVKQAAIYAELYHTQFEALEGSVIGTPLEAELRAFWSEKLHPVRTQLNVRHDPVLPPLPDQPSAETHTDARHPAVLSALRDIARVAGRTTLSGAIFLDHEGIGDGEAGLQRFADYPEVARALRGQVGVALRRRGDAFERHPLSSLSRDTGFRVFVAYPVLSRDHVIGAVYLSRTPLNLGKYVFQERDAMLIMGAFTLTGAALIGYLLWRLLSRPIRGLRDEAHAIAAGSRPGAQPLAHYGARELADLGESVLSMADTLRRRSREITTYTDHVTHELKSPVTSIVGAAELLEDTDLPAEHRAKLLQNIHTEGTRMNTLLARLREMTKLRDEARSEPGYLSRMLPDIDGLTMIIEPGSTDRLPLSNAHGQIILHHMAQNARAHGASKLTLGHSGGVLRLADDGSGLPDTDLTRLSDPFFTTRRDEGGTGMGLAIVSALLDIYDARLAPIADPGGAVFEIHFSGS